MSNAVFPLLPGLDWNLSKAPIFNTKVMSSVNGRELRASFTAVPKYQITLSFGFLRQDSRKELDQIEGFFLARQGSFDSFLLAVPGDSQLINYQLGIGDGVKTSYQVKRSIAGVDVPLQHIDSDIDVEMGMWNQTSSQLMWSETTSKLMWWQDSAASVSNGSIVFNSPPELGQVIYFTGTYYYRCRFKEDTQQYTNFMHNLWEVKKIEMISSLGNKV